MWSSRTRDYMAYSFFHIWETIGYYVKFYVSLIGKMHHFTRDFKVVYTFQ